MRSESYTRVPLFRRDGSVRTYTLVDVADFERVNAHRWCYRVGYARRHVRSEDGKYRPIHLHRFLMGDPPPDVLVDHMNRNTLDNRRCNLRLATRKINQQNVPATGRSPHRGVYLHKASGLWHARAVIDGRTHSLGYFHDEDEAGHVAQQFRLKYMPGATD